MQIQTHFNIALLFLMSHRICYGDAVTTDVDPIPPGLQSESPPDSINLEVSEEPVESLLRNPPIEDSNSAPPIHSDVANETNETANAAAEALDSEMDLDDGGLLPPPPILTNETNETANAAAEALDSRMDLDDGGLLPPPVLCNVANEAPNAANAAGHLPNASQEAPNSSPNACNAADHAANAAAHLPNASPEDLNASPNVSNASNVAPEASNVSGNALHAASDAPAEAPHVTANASNVAPEASNVSADVSDNATANASNVAPEASNVTDNASNVAPEASTAPTSLIPELHPSPDTTNTASTEMQVDGNDVNKSPMDIDLSPLTLRVSDQTKPSEESTMVQHNDVNDAVVTNTGKPSRGASSESQLYEPGGMPIFDPNKMNPFLKTRQTISPSNAPRRPIVQFLHMNVCMFSLFGDI